MKINKKGIAFKVLYMAIGIILGVFVRVDILLVDISAINFVIAGGAFIISYLLSSRQSLRWGFIGFGIANIIIAVGWI